MNANMNTELEQNPNRPRGDVRRDFVKKLAAAGTAALMTGQPQFVRQRRSGRSEGHGRCVHLAVDGWRYGGTRYV